MYLVDTNVISELRKKARTNSGVKQFLKKALVEEVSVFVSVITIGELRRGVELIRHRGDDFQANKLEKWLETILDEYAEHILDFTQIEAQVWGRLRVPNYENALDKQIAAIALVNGLVLVTRNTDDFVGTGVSVLNPFE